MNRTGLVTVPLMLTRETNARLVQIMRAVGLDRDNEEHVGRVVNILIGRNLERFTDGLPDGLFAEPYEVFVSAVVTHFIRRYCR